MVAFQDRIAQSEGTSRGPGIYIHIPFCTRRCYYCDFATWGQNELPSGLTYERYTDLLIREIDIALEEARKDNRFPFSQTSLSADTLYFGGGTPSLMPIPNLERILRKLQASFDLSALSEFTLEVNPETISGENLSAWRGLGINRLSIGVQSLKDEPLLKLGRVYRRRQVLETLNANAEMLANFDVSFDLLLGVPWQEERQVLSDLKELLAFEPKHFSLYGLKVEEGTPFATLVKEKPKLAPNEDRIADELLLAEDFLSEYGFIRYEVSNFAREHKWSMHNLKYWQMLPTFAFGVSAVGFDGAVRTHNPRDFHSYESAISNGIPPAKIEILTEDELLLERLALGLRTIWGVAWKDFPEGIRETMKERSELIKNEYPELFRELNSRISLTGKGMNLLHSIVLKLVE